MKDNSVTSYKSRLPFGLKQKPMTHYFTHGVIKFNMKEGILYYTVKMITRSLSGTLYQGKVKSKEPLDKLLKVKTISDIQSIEAVA